jgi:hypothetical protein
MRVIKELSVHVIENDSLQKLQCWANAANAAPVTSFRF